MTAAMNGQLAVLERKKGTVLPASRFLRHTAVQPIADHTAQAEPAGAVTESDFGQDFSHVAVHSQSGAARSELTPPCPVTPTCCPFGGACHTCPVRVQTKLAINQPGDKYEQEADRVADQLTHSPGAQLQRRTTSQVEPADVPPIVHEVLRSPGQPLAPATRVFMEPRFGHDFSQVRVHTDAQAGESVQAVNALAYTVGRNVVFGPGQYVPHSNAGRRLIAHELTHVVQQEVSSTNIRNRLEITHPNDAVEHEANWAAESIVYGQPAMTTSNRAMQVARQTDESTEVLESPSTMPAEADVGAKADGDASACPVQDKGTLSEVSWGETSGLYPTKDNKYDPDKWDAAKTCELLRARGAVHAVGQRGQPVHKAKPSTTNPIERKLTKYHFIENFPALDAEISDAAVKWFYLSSNADKPVSHPSVSGSERVKSYGSFYNIGGGDVKKGDVYIHFYRVKPKSPKPKAQKETTETPVAPRPRSDNPSDQIHE